MIHETSFLDALEGKSDPHPEVTRATRLVQHLRDREADRVWARAPTRPSSRGPETSSSMDRRPR